MRARIPSKFQYNTSAVAETISAVLAANGLNPQVTIYGNGTIETLEPTISGSVKLQIKNAVLPLLYDTSSDTDIMV